MRKLLGHTLLGSVTSLLLLNTALAGPVGGNVVAGSASIAGQSSSNVNITQSSQRVVIDWNSFDTHSNESVTFNQPNKNAIALNRVLSGSPTQFDGILHANGNVIIMNGNGIVFGKTAKIDVGGLVATSVDVDTNDFMNDARLNFNQAGNSDAKIVNEGTITAREAGLVGFVAPQVENSGTITAKLGKVHLASGDSFTFDFYGDGLVEVKASDAINTQLVKNAGTIKADGGLIAMSAAQARNAVDALVNNTGIIEAKSVSQQNGKIILSGDDATVLNSGTLNANGLDANTKGGDITVTGKHTGLMAGSRLKATGNNADGGTILIGGDYQGQGSITHSQITYVDQDAQLDASAYGNGDGGKVVVWADDTTRYYGSIIAKGGDLGGDGGLVETSGKINLAADGFVDLTAAHGKKGTYLLDPSDITIYGDFAPDYVSTGGAINLASSLKLWMDAADVTGITLAYSTDGLGAATATGTSGSMTITTSANVAAQLAVGARIRLGGAGMTTTADVIGADTYTIAAISGTTITLTSALTQNYTTQTLYRGQVSQITDKSGNSNTMTQSTAAQRPLWISDGSGGAGTLLFDGGDRLIAADSASLDIAGPGLTFLGLVNNLSPTNSGSVGILINKENSYEIALFQLAVKAAVETADPASWAWGGSTPIANAVWNHVGFQHDNTVWRFYLNGASTENVTPAANEIGNITPTNTVLTIGNRAGSNQPFTGQMANIVLYDTVLSADTLALLNQYQSARWNTPLNAPGTGATETDRAMSATGYNVFTTRYLERLSQTADISLLADNTITLDLKGDTLNLANDRSLTLHTTNGNISSVSAGTLQTTRTGSGGNITITAGGTGQVALSNITMNAQGNGDVSVISGGAAVIGGITGGTIQVASGTGSDIILLHALNATLPGTGNRVVLNSGCNLINSGGSINPGTGRYLVYSADPANNVTGGLTVATKRYNKTYTGYAPNSVTETGNVFLYSIAPVITFTADSLSKAQDVPNPALTYTYSNTFIDGDTALTAFTGSPALSTSATLTTPTGSAPINISSGSLASTLGYQFNFVGGTLNIGDPLPDLPYQQLWNPTVQQQAAPVASASVPVVRDEVTVGNGQANSASAANSGNGEDKESSQADQNVDMIALQNSCNYMLVGFSADGSVTFGSCSTNGQ